MGIGRSRQLIGFMFCKMGVYIDPISNKRFDYAK